MIAIQYRIMIILALLMITSCNVIPTVVQPQSTPSGSNTLVMVVFQVKIPEPVPAGESIYLSEVDEVTGLAFNPVLHPMEALDNQNFTLTLPIPLHSLFKYRYLRQGKYSILENAPDDRPLQYRVYLANEPGFVQDVIYRWGDSMPIQGRGRILGKAIRADNLQPIPDLLVTAGGLQTLTLSDGSFVLENLPAGTHQLVAYAQDGSYQVFQQGATVNAGAATEAILPMQPAQMVTVTFNVETPSNIPSAATVRIAGNLRQLGNSFTLLRGGTSNTAIRLPGMQRLADGKYTLSISLPVGSDIRYKYTLGDGIWNAEQDANSQLITRQFIVPANDSVINDQVIRWSDTDQRAVSFDVRVPPNTPADEIIAIQFNPGFAWMEPIPMWLVEPNRWIYRLYSPLKGLRSLRYRYCRDLQCGSADDLNTAGDQAAGREVQLEDQPQWIQDQVESWIWLDESDASAVVPNTEVSPRQPDFIAGVALQEAFHPSWFFRLPKSVADIKQMNANWVILQPSRSYRNTEILYPDADLSMELAGLDLTGFLTYLHSQELNTAIFPRIHYPGTSDQWWLNARRDFPWWVSWFTYYQSLIHHYALLAANTGASALILGDPSVSPALPGGLVADGTPSGVPEDAEIRWRNLIQSVRGSFAGQIWWAVEITPEQVASGSQVRLPPFMDAVDGLYILWNSKLVPDSNPDVEAWAQNLAQQLDALLLPVHQNLNKPVILAFKIPAAQGAASACIPSPEGGCLDFDLLGQPNPSLEAIPRDLKEQEDAYNAIFLAVKDRAWISGVVSDGYSFPIPLPDQSASVHGKPASGVLWFWFGKFLAKLDP